MIDFLIAPGEQDRIVRAVRNNPFVSTDLDLLLKNQKIEALVVLGIGTET
jgi:nicotinamidase-related amidase